ncbi:hypothetical protein ACV35W_34415, partial [Pseudomonas aeruginosa]
TRPISMFTTLTIPTRIDYMPSFIKPAANVLNLAPIFLPLAMKLRIHPTPLGIVMLGNPDTGLVHTH